jgi:Signal recognition particle GTPase
LTKYQIVLNSLIRDLRGLGKITDKNITDTSREIRRILLEADVNINVTREFVNKVKKSVSWDKKLSNLLSRGNSLLKYS